MTFRSLRVRLALLYVIFTLASMSCLGLFSYWYLGRALASSRQETMKRREERILNYINTWPKSEHSLSLNDKLLQLSKAIAESDTIQIYTLDGKLLYTSPAPDIYKVGWPEQDCINPCFDIVHKTGHVIRTLNHVVTLDGRKVRLSIAGTTDEHFDILTMIRNSYLIFCPLLLVVSVAGGFVLSHRALQPVHRITNKARTIGIQDLQQRLPVPQTGDELQVLAETWNGLLQRLDVAVNRLTQFTSDISHDLRTTITVMLTTAEFAMRRSRSEEEYRAALSTIIGECDTTSQLLDDLLAAARADIVQQNLELRPVNLPAVVQEVCEHLRARAETKLHALEYRLTGDAWTMGDSSMLRRMTTILVDNAIKYTPESGAIFVSLVVRGDRIELQVADTGIGIAPDDQSRVFDRFYRVDPSRNQDDGGTGLGLAIAKWIVEAHESTIRVVSAAGKGSTFTVSMPLYLRTPNIDALQMQQKALTA
jgi:two-component system, OmpR family, heavy metal sensor histidine kinase CusS